MAATRLLKDSLLMIKSQEPRLLTVFAPIYLVTNLVQALCVFLWALIGVGGTERVGLTLAGAVLVTVLSIILTIGLAVAWHRSVLAPAQYRPSRGQIESYFWKSVLLILFLILILILPVVGVVIVLRMGAAIAFVEILITLSAQWLALRIALVLPDTAVQGGLVTFAKSWSHTSKRKMEILVVVLFIAALKFIFSKIVDFEAANQAWYFIQFLLFAALSFVPFVLGLSALTQLYKDEVLAEAND